MNIEAKKRDMPADPIKIGVIIVNFNSATYLMKAIQSLAKQTLPANQIIIIDNASKEALPDELLQYNLPIQIIKSPINIGFAAGNNRAMESLSPEINWVALLNPDAYPDENWLMELATVARQSPEYAFMGSQLICEREPHLLDGTGDAYHVSGKAWRKNYRQPLKNAPQQIEELFSPCAAAALYRRDALLAVQGFDEHYFCYYEDIDLAFRLQLLGYKGCYVPKAIAEHTGSATTKLHSDFYTYHGHRNLVWTYLKNMPLPLLIITLPVHLLLNLATVFLFVKRGQTKTILKAKKDAMQQIPRILKQRKSIQKSRIISSYHLAKKLHKGLPW